jgi:peptidylprolyl isomerase
LYLNEDVALSVGRYAYRGIKDTSGTRFAAEVLAEADDAERWKAAYALMRVGERSLMMPYASVMLAQANCSDEDARMFIQTVLGRLGDTRALPGLVARVKNDSDWRVRVNAVKALAQFDPALWDTVLAILADACLDTSALVRLTAIASIGSLSLMDTVLLDDVVPVLIRVIEDQTGERSRTEKEEAAIAFARLRGNGSYSHLKRMLDQGSLDREAYLKSLGYVNDSTVLNDLLPAANDKNARTRRVALEAIQNLGARKVLPIVQLPHARQAIIDALQAEDLAVLTTAASALGDSAFADASSVEPLLNLLRRLHSPDDVEAMVAIVQSLGVLKDERVIPDLSLLLEDPDRTVAMESAIALEQITGASSVAKVKLHTLPQHTDYDWEMLEAIASRPRVVVVTTKGSFEFELMVEQAPFTCLSFARLISRGFYDGLTFHRVVPNFVVQGGDPRGDGWGGPGYAIRSEFWPNMYERGMVGVASAGKDTEGCQFFVTHSRQPHLDGRYTIFGRVISGMEVVDRLEVGDHIRSMRFLESLQGR